MDDYTLIKRIGAGAFGSNYLAKRNEDGKQVVVKERFKFTHIRRNKTPFLVLE